MKIGFFGTPEHSAKLLDALYKSGPDIVFVVTNEDKLSGRKKVLKPPPVKSLAKQLGIEVLQFPSIKSPEAIRKINSYSVDINVVFAYGSIIPQEIFDHPPMGSINLHGSLLPELRGASPVQSAILEGKETTGITIQYVAQKVDSGDIVLKVPIKIDIEDNAQTLMEKVTQVGTESMLKLLQSSDGSKFPGTPQDHERATYCHKIHSNERKLSFEKDSKTIYNKIRAYYPWSPCFCDFRKNRLNIHRSSFYPEQFQATNTPGFLHLIDKKTVGVECGDRKLLLLELLQPENKKAMQAVDFINGFKPQTGEILT